MEKFLSRSATEAQESIDANTISCSRPQDFKNISA